MTLTESITLGQVLWFVAGIATGLGHTWLLWRAAQPPFDNVLWYWARLLLVGGVICLAAVYGGLLPAVLGWSLAYFLTVGLVALQKR